MAVIFRCDRCGTDFSQRAELRTIEIPRLDRHEQNFTEEEGGYTRELCLECWKPIIQLTNRIPNSKGIQGYG